MAYTEFNEVQRFRQAWIWILLGITMAFVLFVPFLTKAPFKWWEYLIVYCIPILSLTLFYILRLETRYDREGIHYRFFPFHFRTHTIPWSDITKAEVIRYNPIGDYGGWGIKWGVRGKAFNVSGNRGLFITLKNGKRILFGTQQPEELADVVSKLRHPSFPSSM